MNATQKINEVAHFIELTRESIDELQAELSKAEQRVRELKKVERNVVLSKKNAAQYLGISRPTLDKYLSNGKIKSLRFDHIHEYKQESK